MGQPTEHPHGSGNIVATLRERIANQELPSGIRLREEALSREFGVSRGRIREAFGALEARGLIERIPNRGAVVARLEAGQVEHLFHVREMLEGLCARLATERGKVAIWRKWRKDFGAPMDADLAQERMDLYLARVEGLQGAIIEEAGNPILRDILDGLQDKTRVLMRRMVIVPGRALQGLKEHRLLLEAMARGDAGRAESLKRRNIRSARDAFLQYADFLL